MKESIKQSIHQNFLFLFKLAYKYIENKPHPVPITFHITDGQVRTNQKRRWGFSSDNLNPKTNQEYFWYTYFLNINNDLHI